MIQIDNTPCLKYTEIYCIPKILFLNLLLFVDDEVMLSTWWYFHYCQI